MYASLLRISEALQMDILNSLKRGDIHFPPFSAGEFEKWLRIS
jgi:hypothetical protein